MSVVRSEVIDGPHKQAHGIWRGTAEVELSDGRIRRKRIDGFGEAVWDANVISIGDEVLLKETNRDIIDGLDSATPIAAKGFATNKQRALAVLRRAMIQEDVEDALRLFDRFNDFRLLKGWTMDLVRNRLGAEGLTAAEWITIRTEYTRLSDNRQLIIDAAAIQADWDNR